jgi:hypothetical protein
LNSHVIHEARVRSKLGQHRNASASVELFEKFPQLSESLFRWWLRAIFPTAQRVSQPTVVRIGELIATRQWRAAADEFSRQSEYNRSLRPGLDACVPLLGMLRRIQLFATGQSRTHHPIDLWLALQELGLQLYPYGPGDRGLWQRAGGDPSDLPNYSSGREAWTAVINQARLGRHSVTIESLTKSMQEDYPNNPDLRRVATISYERQIH